jgi:hypothetical protein
MFFTYLILFVFFNKACELTDAWHNRVPHFIAAYFINKLLEMLFLNVNYLNSKTLIKNMTLTTIEYNSYY